MPSTDYKEKLSGKNIKINYLRTLQSKQKQVDYRRESNVKKWTAQK